MGRRSGKCDIVTGAWDHHKLLNSKPLPLSLVPAIAAGVSNTDTMPLCEFHKVKRVSFTHSRHFLFAQLLTFSGQPLWAWSPLHWVHAARCICLAFSGSSKGWMSLKKICRICPEVERRMTVWAAEKQDVRSSFHSFSEIKRWYRSTHTHTPIKLLSFLKQESKRTHFLPRLVRPVYQTTTAAVFSEGVLSVFRCIGWRCLPPKTNDTSESGTLHWRRRGDALLFSSAT